MRRPAVSAGKQISCIPLQPLSVRGLLVSRLLLFRLYIRQNTASGQFFLFGYRDDDANQ